MKKNKLTTDLKALSRLAKKNIKSFETQTFLLTQELIDSTQSTQSKKKLVEIQRRIDNGRLNFRGKVYDYCLEISKEIREIMIKNFINSAPFENRRSLEIIKTMIEREGQNLQESALNFSNFILLVGLPWDKLVKAKQDLLSLTREK